MKVVQKIEICFNKNFKNDLNLNLKNINLSFIYLISCFLYLMYK